MHSDSDIDALYEALVLEKSYEEPRYPLINGVGGDPKWWSFWGNYLIPPHRNPQNKKDIVYRDTNGVKHRLGGPAYISEMYDIEAWYKEGVLHRIGGPAYRHKSTLLWFVEGKLHRLDGPAVVDLGCPKQYWIDGIKYSAKQYKWEIKRRMRKGLL